MVSPCAFPYVEVMAPKLKAALRIRTVRPSRAHVGSIPEGFSGLRRASRMNARGIHISMACMEVSSSESGAADGRLYSTTLAFDKLDWTSVHIKGDQPVIGS